jgi:hypothetical protein
MIDALLQLGQEQRIPIGIEYIDAAAFRSRIGLHEQDTTLGRLLDTIAHGQGYSWFANGGVVIVTHSGAPQGRKNLLNIRISEFTLAREVTLQERSPCQTASYPRVRRAFTGNASCSALSSWRLTTSGSALDNQASRLSSRLLMLLMLKVATLTKPLSLQLLVLLRRILDVTRRVVAQKPCKTWWSVSFR